MGSRLSPRNPGGEPALLKAPGPLQPNLLRAHPSSPDSVSRYYNSRQRAPSCRSPPKAKSEEEPGKNVPVRYASSSSFAAVRRDPSTTARFFPTTHRPLGGDRLSKRVQQPSKSLLLRIPGQIPD